MKIRASLVVQWLGIRLPMQGTRVQSLVWEDPTCHRATKPVRHNSWACALEPASLNYWARVPQLLKPVCHNYWACALEPASHNYWAREPQLLKPVCHNYWSPRLEPVVRNKRSHHNKPMHPKGEWLPLTVTRESLRSNEDATQPKINK